MAEVDSVNISYTLFRFDPAHSRFVPVQVPAANGPGGNCDGMINVTLHPAEHTLDSACRGGPAWYLDAYRVRADGSLYLYQTSAMLDDDVAALIDTATGDGPPSLRLTYDAQGHLIDRRPQRYEGGTATLVVRVPKLPLYDAPPDAAHPSLPATPTRRYVVAGDRLELTGASEDAAWLRVRFHSPRAGAIDGWIRSTDGMPARITPASGASAGT